MKIKGLILSGLSIFLLAGCGVNDTDNGSAASSESTDSITEESSVDLTQVLESVIVSNEENILVVARVGQGGDLYRLEIDPDKLQTEAGETIADSELTVGQVVEITYSGIIGYSYPAYIPNYNKIVVTEQTDQETLDAAIAAQDSLRSTDATDTAE